MDINWPVQAAPVLPFLFRERQVLAVLGLTGRFRGSLFFVQRIITS
jgi:hypothetical protein